MKTSTLRKHLAAFACAAAMLTASGSALADGIFAAPKHLPSAAAKSLASDIAAARKRAPHAFKHVAQLREQLPALDKNKRGRLAPITPQLRSMGRDGLMPMLERLAVDTPGRSGLTGTAWLTWRVGLLEAVGALRDPRAAAVLEAIVARADDHPLVVRSAAAALGKLGTDRAASILIERSKVRDKRQASMLYGLGYCRRIASVERLAEALAQASDTQHAKVAAFALGNAANAWAWQTAIIQQSGEEAIVRKRAAQALVNGYVAFGHDEVRRVIARAVLTVDHDSTPAMIASRKSGASDEVRRALGVLEARFAKSPLRR